MSSLARMLAILDLYSEAEPLWSAEGIAERIACSRPTAYRYVRELCKAGLLMRISGGAYLLGPRLIELDFQIRRSDPVLHAGGPIMRALVEQTGCDVVLANIYGDEVLNVHHEYGVERLSLSYDRGRPHPRFRGATAKSILAFLPRARLRRLYDAHAPEAAKAGLGRDWETFRQHLAPIRRAGWCETAGELDPHLVGLGAPVLGGEREVLGSLTLVATKTRFAVLDHAKVLAMLLDATRRLSLAIADISHPDAAVIRPAVLAAAGGGGAVPIRATASPARRRLRSVK